MSRIIPIMAILVALTLACSGGAQSNAPSTPTGIIVEATLDTGGSLETPVEPTATPAPLQTEPPPAASAQQVCEALPRPAVSTFLYGLAVGTVVGEEDPDGIYCRFETIDVEGAAGDLGRSRAVVTLKLWDSFAACEAAGSDLSEQLESPPAPWTYLRVAPIPNKPELILSVTGFDGQACLTASAGDISSQPLEHWLAFLGALAAAR